MAATVSAWGKPGGWALDSEENEADLLQQRKDDAAAAAAAAGVHSKGKETAEFPSLAAAAATKTKKKKPQILSLQEFKGYGAEKPSTVQPKGLTPDELMSLPTGPRQRSAEELDRNKLGGGFRSYGGGMRDEQPRRQGSFNRDSNREFTPSRADETDNWASGKKSPGFDSRGDRDRNRDRSGKGGFFTDSQSRADEVDNWASTKSFVPGEPRRYERRGSFGLESTNGGAGADSGNWGRKRDEGSVVSGNRPRLNLQPRTLPLSEEQKGETTGMVKPKGSSPFGEARPREEVLKEKGQDWKEMEEKLEATKIKEVASNDGVAVTKKGFWRDALKEERAWRKPGSTVESGASVSDNGGSDKPENGHAEESEDRGTEM